MNTFDDQNIEFDFFDEPETEEASRPRRRVRRERSGPPRPPAPPTGLVPLARLVGHCTARGRQLLARVGFDVGELFTYADFVAFFFVPLHDRAFGHGVGKLRHGDLRRH